LAKAPKKRLTHHEIADFYKDYFSTPRVIACNIKTIYVALDGLQNWRLYEKIRKKKFGKNVKGSGRDLPQGIIPVLG
jgi:hypothetical protein